MRINYLHDCGKMLLIVHLISGALEHSHLIISGVAQESRRGDAEAAWLRGPAVAKVKAKVSAPPWQRCGLVRDVRCSCADSVRGRLRTRRGGVAPRDRGPRAQSVSGARPAHTAPRTVTVFSTDGSIFGAFLRQSRGEALLSAA